MVRPWATAAARTEVRPLVSSGRTPARFRLGGRVGPRACRERCADFCHYITAIRPVLDHLEHPISFDILARRGGSIAALLCWGPEVGRKVIRKRKTDYGTVILHGLLVTSLVVAIVTGLRIAAETPAQDWTSVLDFVLPKAAVWTGHIDSAVVLSTVSVAYAIYVRRAGLVQRIRLDRVRLRG